MNSKNNLVIFQIYVKLLELNKGYEYCFTDIDTTRQKSVTLSLIQKHKTILKLFRLNPVITKLQIYILKF